MKENFKIIYEFFRFFIISIPTFCVVFTIATLSVMFISFFKTLSLYLKLPNKQVFLRFNKQSAKIF